MAIIKNNDPFFRGFDKAFLNFYREKEWEREFDRFSTFERIEFRSCRTMEARPKIPNNHLSLHRSHIFKSAMQGSPKFSPILRAAGNALGLISLWR